MVQLCIKHNSKLASVLDQNLNVMRCPIKHILAKTSNLHCHAVATVLTGVGLSVLDLVITEDRDQGSWIEED